MRTLTIDAATDAASAAEARAALLAALEAATPGERIALDLSADGPTAVALQLLVAARRSLEAREAFGGLGPHAAAQPLHL